MQASPFRSGFKESGQSLEPSAQVRPFTLPQTSTEISGKTKKLFLQASYPKVLQTPKKDAPVSTAAPPHRADHQTRPPESAEPRTTTQRGNPLMCSLFRTSGRILRGHSSEQVTPLVRANLSIVASELNKTNAAPAEPERSVPLDPALFSSRTTFEQAEPSPGCHPARAQEFHFLPFELAANGLQPQPFGCNRISEGVQLQSLSSTGGLSHATASLQVAEKERYPLQHLSRLVSGLGSKPVPKRTARFDYQLDATRRSSFSRNSSCSLLDTSGSRAADCLNSTDLVGFHSASFQAIFHPPVVTGHTGIFNTTSK